MKMISEGYRTRAKSEDVKRRQIKEFDDRCEKGYRIRREGIE